MDNYLNEHTFRQELEAPAAPKKIYPLRCGHARTGNGKSSEWSAVRAHARGRVRPHRVRVGGLDAVSRRVPLQTPRVVLRPETEWTLGEDHQLQWAGERVQATENSGIGPKDRVHRRQHLSPVGGRHAGPLGPALRTQEKAYRHVAV